MDQPPSQIPPPCPSSFIPPPAKQRSARFYFTPEVDIFLLREVLAVDPFEDGSRWAAIVRNISAVLLRDVVARSLQDRLDLLLARFAARDRENQRSTCAAEGLTALSCADLHDMQYVKAESGSTHVYDLGEAQASATCDDCEVLASVSQLPASTSVSTTGQTAASSSVMVQDLLPSPSPGILHEPSPRPTLNTTPDPTLDPTSTRHPSPILDPTRGSSPGSSSGPTSGSSPGPTNGLFPTIAKGFFEKRLKHEQGARRKHREMEKERLALERERLAVEDRCINLERDKLTLDREVFLQKKREWEETQEKKKEERLARQKEKEQERELYLRQQGALIDLVRCSEAKKTFLSDFYASKCYTEFRFKLFFQHPRRRPFQPGQRRSHRCCFASHQGSFRGDGP
ncbi:hypothetical protein HPB51_003503 [Rhipicephalus microplus]|uniref:Uncharacterized protein n=1 Tax=Rhipicephalus microplus TaxID=6941 RepID=A0A9J6ELF3_RHIMP|nr:hypothetical protein HPB51_003503 [Rhipicephalus microplus]